jgi:hypothetical protein
MRSRPRWGIFSTRAHLDPGALVGDVLLYDRLLFPTPAAGDRERWINEKWSPQAQEERLAELGSLAHTVSWTKQLRDEWSTQFERMSQIAGEADGLAFALTPLVIGISAWEDINAQGTEPIPPIPIAAFQSAAEARAAAAFAPSLGSDPPDAHRGVALLFRQCLAMPIPTHHPVEGKVAFGRAIELSNSLEYQEARRALYDWEDDVVAQAWPVDAAVRALKECMIAHNGLVRSKFGATATRTTFRVVGIAAGAIAGAAVAEKLGALVGSLAIEVARAVATEGVEKIVELGRARLPQFRRSTNAATAPGALLSMAISAIHP